MLEPNALATSPARRLRCSAGPGTGKTFRLKQRVTALLEDAPDRGRRIFAVTFTRQAAANLKEELTAMAVPGAESIVASTLHSHAFSILAREDAIQALGREPRPVHDYELRPFFHDASLRFGTVKDAEKLLAALEAMWARLQTEDPGFPTTEQDRAFNDYYTHWMRLHKAMAIGELIPMAVRFLRSNPQAPAKDRFDHILVDEYQDLNKADQELVQELGSKAGILIVGDDDQSIYGFRYAHPEGIRQWLDEQEDPKEDCQLTLCWRCDGNIVAAANRLIRHNPNRLKGDMTWLPEKEGQGEIVQIQWQTLGREIQGIATGIDQMLENGSIPEAERILVLVPRAEVGRQLTAELLAKGRNDVKLHSKHNWDLLQEPLCLLTLADDPNDLVALRVWLGLGDSKCRREAYAKVMEYCSENDVSPNDVLADEQVCKTLRIPALQQRFVELQDRLEDLLSLTRRNRIDALFPDTSDNAEFGDVLREMDEDADPELTASDLVREYLIAKTATTKEARVNVMTSYAAKGLEAHTVIVLSLVNGLLPTKASPTNVEERRTLQEQRRLMFVAVTRARERLLLSSFRKASRRENRDMKLGIPGDSFYVNTTASRFLGELELPNPAVTGEQWLSGLS